MNCEEFLSRVDAGESPTLPALADHTRSCPACTEAAGRLTARLDRIGSLAPSAGAMRRITLGVRARIQPATPATAVPLFPFRRLVTALAMVCGILIGVVFLPPLFRHPAFLNGPAILMQGQGERLVGRRDRCPVNPGDRFRTGEDTSAELHFGDGRMMILAGTFSCQIGADLSLSIGEGRLAFQPSPKGYRIQLPEVLIQVTGTTLHLRIKPGADTVWVESGSIAWTIPGGGTGQLGAGQGLVFASMRTTPCTGSPLSPLRPSPATAAPALPSRMPPVPAATREPLIPGLGPEPVAEGE